MACACCTDIIPVIAVPIDNVSAKPIPSVTSFGCADIAFSSFCFIVDIFKTAYGVYT